MANNNCSNCYNGCPQIISDQCVRYTGIDVPILGIQKGDSLSYVEQALITFLTSTLDGTGIKPIINPDIICPLVNGYLVQCEDLNVNNLFETLIKVVCDLQVQIDGIDSAITVIQNTLNTLNADYDVDCLSGVTNSSDTHAVLQAVIDKLCQFIIDVDLTYVKIADIDTYIQNYLDSTTGGDYSAKMIPYVAYEYYGPIGVTPEDPSSGFDSTGAGFGKWYRVYLCNGNSNNGSPSAFRTPDRRGRVGVGAFTPATGLDPAVDPATPTTGIFNPSYALGSKFGTNSIKLTISEIPPHSHTTTVTLNPHKHDILGITGGDNNDNNNIVRFAGGDKNQGEVAFYFTNTEACQTTVVTTASVTVTDTGGNGYHSNNQPAIGAYYIMYIPLP
jgi:microcystin-dependent protein